VSVFATSGFDESAILIVDGSGSPTEDLFDSERAVCVDLIAKGSRPSPFTKHPTRKSLPLKSILRNRVLYFSPARKEWGDLRAWAGCSARPRPKIFGDHSEAGKVMGLAPYGRPEFPVEAILRISNRRIHFFDHILWSFQHNDRWPTREIQYKNLACSVQLALDAPGRFC